MSPSALHDRIRALEDEHRERRVAQVRTLAGCLCVVVVATAADADPGLGLSGRGLALSAAVAVFCAAALWPVRRAATAIGRPGARSLEALAARPELLLLAGAAVAITWLQPDNGGDVAPAAAVWTLMAVLPLAAAVPLAVVVALATAAAALAADGPSGAASELLLCGVLAVTGLLVRRAGEGTLEAKVLLAERDAARAGEARAAATAERARIARDLHDVLAHALSGAALQLEGARALARREPVSDALRGVVDRAAELVRDGLGDARDAVGALQGDALPGLADLPGLVADSRADLGLAVTLVGPAPADGPPAAPAGPLPVPSAEAQLALYRGVQEALVNAARHAPGAMVTVQVDRDEAGVRVEVADRGGGPAPPSPGGGHGLAGMRERLARAGGRAEAGPVDGGWRVALEVPA